MATEIIMPRVDMDMAEGKIAAWYVKNGDHVRKGQTLFDIETDKATMEVDAEAEGIVGGISGELGVPIPVGQPVAWLLAPGEALPAAEPQPGEARGQAVVVATPPERAAAGLSAPGQVVAGDTAPATEADENEAITTEAAAPQALLRATPLARSLARERGIDLCQLRGSGPDGCIVGRDVSDSSGAGAPPDRRPADNLHLNWLARATGTPVVLLHGFGSDHGSWRPLAACLPGLPLVGIDLPNHGKSARFAVGDIEEVGAAVLRRLDEEGITACHLVGHSLGGAAALAMSRGLGSRLRSLTLIAPAGLGPDIHGDFIAGLCRATGEPSLRAWLRELVHDDAWLTGSFVATAWQQLRAPGQRAALEAMAQALLPDGTQAALLRPLLEPLRVPVKVIWGGDDRIIPARHGARLPGRVALHLLPAVGHLPQIEAVEIVAELLLQQRQAGGRD